MRQSLSRTLVLLALVLLLVKPNAAKANHSAGGELMYEWISDSTYRIFLKYYRDCTGDTAPATFTVCLNNTCNNTTTSATMTKFSNTGIGPGYGCPQLKTKCDSPASAINGFITWTYSAIVTLPRCSLWRFYTYGAHRSNNDNIQNATNTSFYLEATLNNAQFQGNSSPYFSIRPYGLVCLNVSAANNAGAIDPNGDSVVTDIITPLTGVTSCGASPINATFALASPAYNTSTNPFPTSNSFTLNANTGQFSFTPTVSGTYIMLLRVKEYRSGSLVGSVMREMPFQAVSCPVANTSTVLDTNSISGATHIGDSIIGCPGQTLSFCWYSKCSDTSAYLVLQDNHLVFMTSANVVYSFQRRDSVRGCITWTPALKDTGWSALTVTLIDSSCRIGKPVPYYFQYRIPFRILPNTQILKDTTICPNGSATLKAIGGGSYTWSVLSGAPGSLSCTNCNNPVAMPSVTSQYEVITTANAYCNHNRDTVTVTVLPFTYPSVSITVSPDSNIIKGQQAIFQAIPNNCGNPEYQWVLNGNNIPGAILDTWSSPTLNDLDVVSCKLSCRDTCPAPADTISNAITMHITDTTNSVYGITANDLIKIYPNPNKGSFTISQLKNEKGTVEITNVFGQEVYSGELNGTDRKQIQLHAADQGLYMLRIKTPERTLSTRVMILY